MLHVFTVSSIQQPFFALVWLIRIKMESDKYDASHCFPTAQSSSMSRANKTKANTPKSTNICYVRRRKNDVWWSFEGNKNPVSLFFTPPPTAQHSEQQQFWIWHTITKIKRESQSSSFLDWPLFVQKKSLTIATTFACWRNKKLNSTLSSPQENFTTKEKIIFVSQSSVFSDGKVVFDSRQIAC